MADEITVRTVVSLVNGTTSRSIANYQHKVDQATATTAPLYDLGERTVPIVHEPIPFGDVATVGELYVLNKDDTNYFQIGTDDTGTFVPGGVKCDPGRDGRFQVDDSLTLYWRANTAPVKVELGAVAT